MRGLTVNFRSRPEILDVVNAAFAPLLGAGFTPLVAGRAPRGAAAVRARSRRRSRASSCWPARRRGWEQREAELGLAALAAQPWRRAEARAVAARLRDGGRRAAGALRDLVVLVRATSSLRLYEQALEEQGLPTYVVGGRGYWSQEQVRDGIAYLVAAGEPARRGRALRRARLAVLRRRGPTRWCCSPRPAGARGDGAWAALRRRRRRRPPWLADLPAEDGRAAAARSRASPRASGCAPSGCRSRCCSSARSRRRATTSRSSPARAATGGSRTCAS